jgi:hypothetical protein
MLPRPNNPEIDQWIEAKFIEVAADGSALPKTS